MIKLHSLIAGEDIRSGGRGALRGQSLRPLVKNGLMVFISVFVYLYFGAVTVADQPVERSSSKLMRWLSPFPLK